MAKEDKHKHIQACLSNNAQDSTCKKKNQDAQDVAFVVHTCSHSD